SAAVASAPAATVAHAELKNAALLRQLWAGSLALPVQLGLVWVGCRLLYPAWRPPAAPALSSRLGLAVGAWSVLTPLVLLVNLVVNQIFTLFDMEPVAHELTTFAGREPFDTALYLFRACVAAPITEELFFRGVVLTWTLGARKPQPAPDVARRLR